MPIFEFECMACGSRVEQFIQNQKDRLGACPRCGGDIKQLFSSFGIFMGKAPLSFYHKFAFPHYDAKKP